jgi:hypothetical protein
MWKLYTSLKNCIGTFDTVEKLEEHVNSNSQLDKFSLIVETPGGQVLRYATPADTKINYQVMAAPAADGKYYPNYDALIAGASCEEEVKYLNEVKKRNFSFAYNMVYVTRQACGHFEIFQTSQNEHYPLGTILVNAIERATERKCTRCVCKW